VDKYSKNHILKLLITKCEEIKMNKEEQSYLYLIPSYIAINIYVPFTAKFYGYSMFLLGVYYVIKTQNNEALMAAAYIAGAEVLLRMTGGNVTYEFSKYGVMFFVPLGCILKGFPKDNTLLDFFCYYWFLV
jgi:hypothetical protein